MFIYWFIFLTVSIAAMNARPQFARSIIAWRLGKEFCLWSLLWSTLTIIIGLRFEVGGDWFNYINYIERVHYMNLSEVLALGDPGYQLLCWVSEQLGWGLVGANFLSAILFVTGLIYFCRSQPRPALALVTAVPYMVIVLAMGYTRQSVALGLGMIGLVALGKRENVRFVFWVVLGATFHKSAVLLIPLAALSASKNKYWTFAWVTVAAYLAYNVLLEDAVEKLYTNYIEAEYQSSGALIRVLMNAVPAAIFLFWRKRFQFFNRQEYNLWLWVAWISLFMIVILIYSPSSTAVDRVALYFLPLQLVVFARFPEVVGSRNKKNRHWVFWIIIYYGLVQFVWLNFASHAFAWLPYQFAPFH